MRHWSLGWSFRKRSVTHATTLFLPLSSAPESTRRARGLSWPLCRLPALPRVTPPAPSLEARPAPAAQTLLQPCSQQGPLTPQLPARPSPTPRPASLPTLPPPNCFGRGAQDRRGLPLGLISFSTLRPWAPRRRAHPDVLRPPRPPGPSLSSASGAPGVQARSPLPASRTRAAGLESRPAHSGARHGRAAGSGWSS